MPTYHLYLEQGPPAKRTGARKTMVHVLDLLGCAPKAKSEEAALALVPSAIEVYARWLSGSGEDIATGPLETVIAERWEGQQDWAGQGYMDGAFQAELAPIDADEVERYVQRFEAMRQAMTAALDALSPDEVA
ncbi:MAG: hypothetical protein KIT87_15455, partial [Anaerolineae bacterium]|nr:hypothetical protein [Anaerolineae bacterium]